MAVTVVMPDFFKEHQEKQELSDHYAFLQCINPVKDSDSDSLLSLVSQDLLGNNSIQTWLAELTCNEEDKSTNLVKEPSLLAGSSDHIKECMNPSSCHEEHISMDHVSTSMELVEEHIAGKVYKHFQPVYHSGPNSCSVGKAVEITLD